MSLADDAFVILSVIASDAHNYSYACEECDHCEPEDCAARALGFGTRSADFAVWSREVVEGMSRNTESPSKIRLVAAEAARARSAYLIATGCRATHADEIAAGYAEEREARKVFLSEVDEPLDAGMEAAALLADGWRPS